MAGRTTQDTTRTLIATNDQVGRVTQVSRRTLIATNDQVGRVTQVSRRTLIRVTATGTAKAWASWWE